MRRILAVSMFVLSLSMLGSATSFAGKNSDGALIVHTDDNVSYTYTGQYCGAHFSDPGTCENAVTTTNKNENTPALIWLLAAFPDTASPAVTVVYFGIEHNLAEGSFANHGFCGPAGSLEIPDAGWPDTGFGNSVAFGSPVQGDILFPFYWFAAYGTTGSYLGTAQNPTGGYAAFVDDGNPPAMDTIEKFGRALWDAEGSNECPGGVGDQGGPDFPEDPSEPGSPESPTLPILKPSTDKTPFHEVDLYAHQVGASGWVSNHWRSFGYPAFLQDTSMVMIRDYEDTVAVCHSFANDHVLLKWNDLNNEPAIVSFGVAPPRLATSLFLLNMINLAAPDDGGEQIGFIELTDEHANGFLDTLSIGSELRCTWKHDCEADLYTQHSTNPFCGEIWSDSHEYGDSIYYDIQELALPKEWWSRRITEVEVSLLRHDYYCRDGWTQTSLVLSGASLGTDFRVVNAQGDSVGIQHQFASEWAGDEYGGYKLNGIVYGDWYTIGVKGCFITCASMVNEFYGQASTPGALNDWLQRNGGYAPTVVATVRSVGGVGVGDSVRINLKPKMKFKAGERLLVEHGDLNPVATLAVVNDTSPSQQNVLTRIDAVHSENETVTTGDKCLVFWDPWHGKLAAFGGNTYSLKKVDPVEGSPFAVRDSAEAIMSRMELPMLNVKGGGHWVLGTGMEPRIDPVGGQHRGTYSIADPGHRAPDDLLDTYRDTLSYQNKFRGVRAFRPTGAPLVSSGSLRATVLGDATLQIIDPEGRRLLWSDGMEDYSTDIEGLVAEHAWTLPDIDADTTVVGPEMELVTIENPRSGNYLMELLSQEPESPEFSLQVSVRDVNDEMSHVYADTSFDAGQSRYYLLTYTTEPETELQIQEMQPGDVRGISPGSGGPSLQPFGLSVFPVPSTGPIVIEFDLARSTEAEVSIFSVVGARVATLGGGRLAAGRHRYEWSGKTSHGPAPAGIYFLSVRLPEERRHRRFILVR